MTSDPDPQPPRGDKPHQFKPGANQINPRRPPTPNDRRTLNSEKLSLPPEVCKSRTRRAHKSLTADRMTEPMPAKDAFSGTVRLANQLKIAIGVPDPDGVWKKEWGDLYRDESE